MALLGHIELSYNSSLYDFIFHIKKSNETKVKKYVSTSGKTQFPIVHSWLHWVSVACMAHWLWNHQRLPTSVLWECSWKRTYGLCDLTFYQMCVTKIFVSLILCCAIVTPVLTIFRWQRKARFASYVFVLDFHSCSISCVPVCFMLFLVLSLLSLWFLGSL